VWRRPRSYTLSVGRVCCALRFASCGARDWETADLLCLTEQIPAGPPCPWRRAAATPSPAELPGRFANQARPRLAAHRGAQLGPARRCPRGSGLERVPDRRPPGPYGSMLCRVVAPAYGSPFVSGVQSSSIDEAPRVLRWRRRRGWAASTGGSRAPQVGPALLPS
jgi:hypothetical protein